MSYDLAIIGGGGAAFAAAAAADELGSKTVVFNKGLPLGGTCVNVGCVPSKVLLEAGFDRRRVLKPRFRAIKCRAPEFSFPEAIAEKEEIVHASREAKYEKIMRGFKHVELVEKRARLDGPGRIRADNRLFEAEYVLLATGSSNKPLLLPGLETLAPGSVLDNIAAFDLREMPKSMIVIGAGPTGLEVAQMFARFGTKIACVEALDRPFSLTEPEVSRVIEDVFKEDGIELCAKMTPKAVRQEGREVVLAGEVDGKPREFRAEKLFVAVGVKGNSEDLNLSSVGLKADKNGFVEVDETLRTRAGNVYAAGDVAGPPWLETVGAREGANAVKNALGGQKLTINYEAVPAAVFTDPQIAVVGLTEAQAIERFGACDCRGVELKYVSKAAITNELRGYAKMVIHPKDGKVLGFHVISPNAAELIHEPALAIQHGLKASDLIDLVHVFPTYSEVVKIAAQAFKRDVRHMSCCVE